MAENNRRVLVAGATGLVGGFIVNALLDNTEVSEVHVLTRRPLSLNHPKLHAHLVDFQALPALPVVDEVYLALGTTIKVAGGKTAFRAVDFEANLAVAKAAVAAGVTRIGLVSAVGASIHSSMFYSRVKGELEQALKALGLTTLVIARPSLLLGSRAELQQPVRIGERIATPIAKLLAPITPAAYRPVSAQAVAETLVAMVPRANGLVVLSSGRLIKGEKT